MGADIWQKSSLKEGSWDGAINIDKNLDFISIFNSILLYLTLPSSTHLNSTGRSRYVPWSSTTISKGCRLPRNNQFQKDLWPGVQGGVNSMDIVDC